MPAAPNDKVVLDPERITKDELRISTSHRKIAAILTSVLFSISTVFLVMVNVGQVSRKPGLVGLYMFHMDVSNIVPSSVPNASLVNSLARSIGLHDFYQVGMWNYCEGYNDQGVTYCSPPRLLFWFNPVQILLNELLAGATITIPSEITMYLGIIKLASQVMFGCFFASTMCAFICIFLCPVALLSRLWTIPVGIFALLTAIAACIGAAISTAIWTILTNIITGVAAEINIVPETGRAIFAFEWIAAGCALIAALIQLGLMCCGTSRRDIKTGRRVSRGRWRQKVIADGTAEEAGEMAEKPKRRFWGPKKNTIKA